MEKKNKSLIFIIIVMAVVVFGMTFFQIKSRSDRLKEIEEKEKVSSEISETVEEAEKISSEAEITEEAYEEASKETVSESPSEPLQDTAVLKEVCKPVPENVKKQETRDFWTIREDMVKNVQEFKKVNPDTVGWLYLWDTTVDSPVFQRAGDNDYYLKHNDYKQEDKNGALVSDFNNILTGRDTQSKNIVVYGHSKDEDPDGGVEISREFEHFTELKRWQNIDFCRSHPYFLFATEDESEVFEVFAAFHTKTEFAYNIANPTKEQQRAILEEAKKKSLFNFNVDVNENDRIITLSTCCRRIVPTYPNGYRFVIMGRLVEKGKLLDYDRRVEVNPTALTKTNIYD